MTFFKTIYFKIISICVVILLCVAGMIGFIHAEASKAIRQEYMNSLDGSFSFSAESFEKELQNAVMILNIISVDDDVRRYLYNYGVLSVYGRYVLYENISSLFSQFTYMNGIIKDIGIITKDRTRELSYSGDRKPEGFFPDAMEGVLYERGGRLFIVQSEKRKTTSNALFYVEFNRDYFEELAENMRAVVPGAELAFAEGDRIIYRTSDSIFRESVVLDLNGLGKETENGLMYSNNRIFIYPVYINSMKMFIGFEDRLLSNSARKLDDINYIVLTLLVLQAVLLSLYIHYVLNKPMKRLVCLMEEVGRGNLKVEIEQTGEDQFGFIFRGFQNMIHDLSQYIQINYDQQLEIERGQLKQLQAQINPHFLYNCFFNISKLCKIEDVDTAALFSQKLAAYYMYITRNSRDEVMLKEEYQHASDYLEIQGIRFYNKVAVRMEALTQEQERLRVPRIILQPILENCYKYVFERVVEKGILYVHCSYEEDVLLLMIEDSGIKGEADLPEKMNLKLLGTDVCQESTGIVNVHRRLRLKRKENGIHVDWSSLGGIRVTMRIVYTKKDEVGHVSIVDC